MLGSLIFWHTTLPWPEFTVNLWFATERRRVRSLWRTYRPSVDEKAGGPKVATAWDNAVATLNILLVFFCADVALKVTRDGH